MSSEPSLEWKHCYMDEMRDAGIFPPDIKISFWDEKDWDRIYDNHLHRQQMMQEKREGQASLRVVQNVYTIRRWAFILPNLLWGVYHSGIYIEGLGEFSFDLSGIRCQTSDEVRDISELRFAGGKTTEVISNHNNIQGIIDEMQDDYPPESYHYLEKNCHHFCDDLAERLDLDPLDERYKRAPELLQDWKKSFVDSNTKQATAAVISCAAVAGTIAAVVTANHRG